MDTTIHFPADSGGDDRIAEIQTVGSCLEETIQRLHGATNPEERLSSDEVEVARDQAADVVQSIVSSYSRRVASGEVGANGSGRASSGPPTSGECPTGLLYGKVQSGKTRAMIFAAAMCIDNGFRVVVVLTSDNVKLVDQTSDRLNVIEGPIQLHSNDRNEWDADEAHIREHLHHTGLVVVCSKNGRHQNTLLDFLRRVDAAKYPAVIFDDEADQATPDTTRAARSRGGVNAPRFRSTTNRLVMGNEKPDELGNSLREILVHNVYVQLTATPYALLLQGIDDPLRPDFTHIVKPGDGYLGGGWYFNEAVVMAGRPPLCYVAPAESSEIESSTPSDVPAGLRHALNVFVLSAAAAAIKCGRAYESYVFLCHTSHRQQDHAHLEALVRGYLSSLLAAFTGPSRPQWAVKSLELARVELSKTIDLSEGLLEKAVLWAAKKLRNRNVVTVNAQGGDLTFRPGLNFLIGGNILGRGLTLPNLLVTYYLRSPLTGQMDTMLQHARMFGYSRKNADLIRVFLPQLLAQRFGEIVETENALRHYLEQGDPSQPIPVRVVQALRVTRRNVLDTSSLSGYRPGQQVYPMEPEFEVHEIKGPYSRISEILENEVFRGPIQDGRFVETDIGTVQELISSVRIRDEAAGSWDTAAIRAVLDDLSPEYGARAQVYVRRGVRSSGPTIPSGAASGTEQAEARRRMSPVLMMFEQQGREENGWDGAPFWFPTVVFPTNMDARIFTVD